MAGLDGQRALLAGFGRHDIASRRAGACNHRDQVQRMVADPYYASVITDELNIVLRHDYLPLDEVFAAAATARHEASGHHRPQRPRR